MIRNVPKPELSPKFTIDDIHKIREWHYEMYKDCTPEERHAIYNEAAARVRERVEGLK